jgi:hypothetical protein
MYQHHDEQILVSIVQRTAFIALAKAVHKDRNHFVFYQNSRIFQHLNTIANFLIKPSEKFTPYASAT